MRRSTIGVVGAGLVTQTAHLPSLTVLSDRFELSAICDASPTVRGGVADRRGDPAKELAGSPAGPRAAVSPRRGRRSDRCTRAGDGSRTRVIALEGRGSTVELPPRGFVRIRGTTGRGAVW